MRHDFPSGLVVCNDARWRGIDPNTDGLAVDLDVVTELNTLADMGRLGVYRISGRSHGGRQPDAHAVPASQGAGSCQTGQLE